MSVTIRKYLELMDAQRESAFDALEDLSTAQLWQRPVPKQWSIGEILDHNYLLTTSMLAAMQWMWRLNSWYGRLRRKRPYTTEIADLYRDPKFPHWVGFLWTPRFNTGKIVPLVSLKSETRTIQAKVRNFYENKDEDILGNLYLYDPIFGWCNLIVTLRIGIYHDQMHYEDAVNQSALLQT